MLLFFVFDADEEPLIIMLIGSGQRLANTVSHSFNVQIEGQEINSL